MAPRSGNGETVAIEIYTLPGCVHCARALDLLRRREIAYQERSGVGIPRFRATLAEVTGRSTVPQVVIRGEPVGGNDRLAALDRAGALLPLVRGDAFPHAVAARRRALRGKLGRFLGFGDCADAWRHEVIVIDRRGGVLERTVVASSDAADDLARRLNARASGPIVGGGTSTA